MRDCATDELERELAVLPPELIDRDPPLMDEEPELIDLDPLLMDEEPELDPIDPEL